MQQTKPSKWKPSHFTDFQRRKRYILPLEGGRTEQHKTKLNKVKTTYLSIVVKNGGEREEIEGKQGKH